MKTIFLFGGNEVASLECGVNRYRLNEELEFQIEGRWIWFAVNRIRHDDRNGRLLIELRLAAALNTRALDG